jgi:ribosomal-protein-alanine N-acetyltransferase
MTLPISIIETERTYLRQLMLTDIDNVMDIFSDPEAMKYSPTETPQSRTDAEEFINWNIESYHKNGLGAWAVIAKSTERYIGQAGLILQEPGLEVFYSFIQKFWKQGFATEVASACRDYAFHKLNESQLIAIIHPRNKRAISVALKLGMRDTDIIEFWGRANRLFKISKSNGLNID